MNHEKTTQFITSCAESFRIDIAQPDVNNWSAGLTMARALDTIVDDDHMYDSGTYAEELLAGKTIPYTTDQQSDFIRTTYEDLSAPTQERWQNAATRLGFFALKRLEAEDIKEYVEVVFDESQLMADVLKVETSPERGDHPQRQTFNTWLNQMARTGYIADTLSDFIRDHNEGNMNIQPTLRGAAVLARHTAKEGLEFARITPLPVYAAMGRRAISKSFEKIQQPGFLNSQFVRQGATKK